MSISPGTTPQHTFTTDISLVDVEVLYITYQQLGRTILEKTKDDCDITADEVTVDLTQQETLLFDDRYPVKIQIRGRYADSQAVKSNTMETTVDGLLKRGVI